MLPEQLCGAEHEMDFPSLCRVVADASPMPMAGLDGPLHTLRYVNLAFCLLTGKANDELIGRALRDLALHERLYVPARPCGTNRAGR